MIVVAGEALVDLAPRGEHLLPLPGGSPYNVAVGLARLDADVRYLGGLSSDGFGQMMADRLRAEGADLTLALWTDAPTTLAVVHLDDDGRASYGFYLDGTSASSLEEHELPSLPAGAALHVSLGAIGLEHEPAGRTLATLMANESRHRFVSFDPNIRPSAILGDTDDYAALMDTVVADLTLVKVSDEDLQLLHPDQDPIEVARSWATSGPALVVVTRGPHGAVAVAAEDAPIEVPGEAVEVVDTVGAGDAFTSGLLAWLGRHDALSDAGLRALDAAQIEAALSYARHVAAITCTRAGSDPPRAAELHDAVG
jgi:fructokinase